MLAPTTSAVWCGTINSATIEPLQTSIKRSRLIQTWRPHSLIEAWRFVARVITTAHLPTSNRPASPPICPRTPKMALLREATRVTPAKRSLSTSRSENYCRKGSGDARQARLCPADIDLPDDSDHPPDEHWFSLHRQGERRLKEHPRLAEASHAPPPSTPTGARALSQPKV